MLESIAAILLALAFGLQAIAIALALRLVLATWPAQRPPAWWAWVLAATGLLLILVRQGMTLSQALPRAQITDSILTAITFAFLAIAIVALFRRLPPAESVAQLYEDLQVSRERYRTLIENAKDAIFIENEDDDILDVNTQACKLLGYSHEELLRMKVPDLQAPEARGQLGDVVKSELERSDRVFETIDLHHDGTRIPVEVSIARIPGGEQGIALAIVRDITERKRAEQALRESEQRHRALFAATQRQAQELELLDKVRTALARELDLVAVFRTVIEAIASAFGYRHVGLYMLEADVLVLQHHVGYDQVITHIPITQGIRGRVARTGKAVLLQDVSTDPDFLKVVDGIVSEICVPLFDQDRVVGVLDVETANGTTLTEADLRLMTSLSEHIGIAIGKARLFSSLSQEKERLELLYNVARQLSASLDVRQVAQRAMDGICAVTGAASGVIYVHEPATASEGDYLRLATVAGKPVGSANALSFRLRVGEGLTGWVAAIRQPALVDDVRQDEHWRSFSNGDEQVRSALSVPLLCGDELVGVLTLGSDRAGYFNREHLRLVESAAAGVAVAIANARLYQETAHTLARLQALAQISRAVSSSLELGQVLNTIARHAAELSNSDGADIFELDEVQQVLSITAGYNTNPEFVEAVNNANIQIGQDVIGRAVASHQPAEIVDNDANSNYSFSNLMAIGGYHSALAVPMLNHTRLVGGIVIWRQQPKPFSNDVIELLKTLADQSVVAIENARLYREAARRLEEVSLIQSVAMAGAAGQPFDNIVAEATERLSRLWDSHHLGFLFPDESGDLRVHPSYKGLSSEVKESLRLLPGQGLTGWVFQTGKPVVTPDVRQSPRHFKTEASTLSEMDAPLVVGDRVIGVVNVESTRINAFSDDDLHLLSALAGQLAVILDNAQARRDLADWAQQLQDAYHELAQAEQLKDQLVQNISHELRTPLTYIRGFTELMLAEAFGSLPKELREPIEMINRKTETVTHLIERIVALQAMNPLELSPEPLEITDLIDETVEHWKLLAQKANIEITSDVPGDLPLVAGDRRQLGEALDNLLNNAVKFNVKGGKVVLRARGEAELVHIEISDTGIGIPFDKLSRVFDRFYQVDGTTRRRFGGAGVGLTLARQMVEAHGGHVWAESPGVGKGSTFHLILPTAPVGGR